MVLFVFTHFMLMIALDKLVARFSQFLLKQWMPRDDDCASETVQERPGIESILHGQNLYICKKSLFVVLSLFCS